MGTSDEVRDETPAELKRFIENLELADMYLCNVESNKFRKTSVLRLRLAVSAEADKARSWLAVLRIKEDSCGGE